MSAPGVLTINTDGGARGNPGPAAYAYIIQCDGGPPIEEAGCIGDATNNQAEYTALIHALEHATRLGMDHQLLIHSDSELLVKQMNGEYRVKDARLKPLFEQARRLASRFPAVTIRHVPRSQNAWADRLYNAALDGAGKRPARIVPSQRQAAVTAREKAAYDEAVECLRAAARAWAGGNPNDPAPELVWEQLWNVLEEEGVVRASSQSRDR